MNKKTIWFLRNKKRGIFIPVAVALLGAVLLATTAPPLYAAAAAEGGPAPLSGWELENQVRRVSEQVRCMVCRGQSVWDSQSGWAFDRRDEIREMLLAGATETEVLDAFVSRWGTGILMQPPMEGFFWAVWLLPGALLLVAGAVLAALLRRWRRPVLTSAAQGAPPAAGPGDGDPEEGPTTSELAAANRRLRQLQEEL